MQPPGPAATDARNAPPTCSVVRELRAALAFAPNVTTFGAARPLQNLVASRKIQQLDR